MTTPLSPRERLWRDFNKHTADHQLTVLHHDGLYRHLRVRHSNGSAIWGWDAICAPGTLTLTGDLAAGVTFSRVPDMLDFFLLEDGDPRLADGQAPDIDMRYWVEKILSATNRKHLRVYSRDVFLRQVRESVDEAVEDGELTADQAENTYSDAQLHGETEVEAHEWLSHNEVSVGADTWEWDLTRLDSMIVLACYQVYLTARLWHEYATSQKGHSGMTAGE